MRWKRGKRELGSAGTVGTARPPHRPTATAAPVKTARDALLLGMAVCALAWIATRFGAGAGAGVAAVWPVDAVILAALSRAPARRWPILMLAAVIGETASSLYPLVDWRPQFGLALCDVLEAAVAAAALLRWLGPGFDLSRRRDLAIFGLVALAASVTSALPASLVFWLAHGSAPTETMPDWILGDTLGLVIVAPALLTMQAGELKTLFSARGRPRTLAVLGGEAAIVTAACLYNAPLLKVLIVLAMMAPAVELGMTGAAIGVLLGGATMIGLTSANPALVHTSLKMVRRDIDLVQIVLAIVAVATLGLAATLADRRRLQEELERKRDEAEAAARAKTEFLANMSHEIRTPLTAIIGFAGLIDAMEGLPPSAADYVDRIVTAGQTLLSVVNDILDFSKIEAGQIELDPQPFAPGPFIEQTIGLAAGQAEGKGLSLVCDIAEDMPAALLADSSRIRQVLLNLISNAVKFTDRGCVAVQARYDPIASGRLRLSVTDTGAGIAGDKLDRLFKRFSQVDGSTSRTHGGTGLGLVICKSLTELMGGDIGVESAEGQGSTFWITIPAPLADLAQVVAESDDCDEEMLACRILIVDDLAVNRELISVMLNLFGHTLTEACNGQEAVEAALRTPFDLILMDLNMPGMDGLAATRAIRADSDLNRDTPIVALSANAMASHVADCVAAGMNDHIAKPIDPGTLLSKVAYWTAAVDEGLRLDVA